MRARQNVAGLLPPEARMVLVRASGDNEPRLLDEAIAKVKAEYPHLFRGDEQGVSGAGCPRDARNRYASKSAGRVPASFADLAEPFSAPAPAADAGRAVQTLTINELRYRHGVLLDALRQISAETTIDGTERDDLCAIIQGICRKAKSMIDHTPEAPGSALTHMAEASAQDEGPSLWSVWPCAPWLSQIGARP